MSDIIGLSDIISLGGQVIEVTKVVDQFHTRKRVLAIPLSSIVAVDSIKGSQGGGYCGIALTNGDHHEVEESYEWEVDAMRSCPVVHGGQ